MGYAQKHWECYEAYMTSGAQEKEFSILQS